ncbi:hypothetical protein Dimus_017923 [Dionaea muscipula]
MASTAKSVWNREGNSNRAWDQGDGLKELIYIICSNVGMENITNLREERERANRNTQHSKKRKASYNGKENAVQLRNGEQFSHLDNQLLGDDCRVRGQQVPSEPEPVLKHLNSSTDHQEFIAKLEGVVSELQPIQFSLRFYVLSFIS